MGGGAVATQPAGMDMNIPMGAAGGEQMCPCPDDEDSVTFEFDMDDFVNAAADERGEPEPPLRQKMLVWIPEHTKKEEEDPLAGLSLKRKIPRSFGYLQEISDEEENLKKSLWLTWQRIQKRNH